MLVFGGLHGRKMTLAMMNKFLNVCAFTYICFRCCSLRLVEAVPTHVSPEGSLLQPLFFHVFSIEYSPMTDPRGRLYIYCTIRMP